MGFLDNVLNKSRPTGKQPSETADAGFHRATGLRRPRAQAGTPRRRARVPASHPDAGGLLGGLGGLLEKFQQSGHGDVAKSWVGSGQNQPISPGSLGSALGPSIIKALSEKTGLSEQEVTAQLSQLLPGLVDKLTPQGRLPTHEELARFGG